MEDAFIHRTVQRVHQAVLGQSGAVGVFLQLDDRTARVSDLHGVEEREQGGVVEDDGVEAEDVGVPFDLGGEIVAGDADVIGGEGGRGGVPCGRSTGSDSGGQGCDCGRARSEVTWEEKKIQEIHG